jgi:hypothetical protein
MTKKPSTSEKPQGVIRTSPYVIVVSVMILIRILSIFPFTIAANITDFLYNIYRITLKRKGGD